MSALLHQRIEHDVFVQICSILYGPAPSPIHEVDAEPVVGIAKDITVFIQALRDAAKPWNDPEIYALMVFDFVLTQVGGLAFGSYGNRIVDQQSAAYLLAVVGEWYRRVRNSNQIEANQ